MSLQEATLEFCPMRKDINKLQRIWLRERELAVQGEVQGAGLVYLEERSDCFLQPPTKWAQRSQTVGGNQ